MLHLREAQTKAHPMDEELLELVQNHQDLRVHILLRPPFQVPALLGRFLVEELLQAEDPDL